MLLSTTLTKIRAKIPGPLSTHCTRTKSYVYRAFSSRDPQMRLRHVGVQLVHIKHAIVCIMQSCSSSLLSSYAENLSNEAKARYRGKIVIIGGLDPFKRGLGEPCIVVPPVDASDLVAYLVLQTNFITTNQFKARKSLEAYNQFVCGWVRAVCSWKVAEKFAMTGCVSLCACCMIAYLS